MDVGGVIGLLIGLAVVVALAFYFVSNYEDPPLWWPNFARPDWDKVSCASGCVGFDLGREARDRGGEGSSVEEVGRGGAWGGMGA